MPPNFRTTDKGSGYRAFIPTRSGTQDVPTSDTLGATPWMLSRTMPDQALSQLWKVNLTCEDLRPSNPRSRLRTSSKRMEEPIRDNSSSIYVYSSVGEQTRLQDNSNPSASQNALQFNTRL